MSYMICLLSDSPIFYASKGQNQARHLFVTFLWGLHVPDTALHGEDVRGNETPRTLQWTISVGSVSTAPRGP